MRKTNLQAEKFRSVGNKFFFKNNHCEAILAYNCSLCYAEVGSESLSLAFGNRSAAYMCLGEYKLCLSSIELAKSHGYPRDKLDKLLKREAEAKKLLDDQQTNKSDEDKSGIFELSYPASQKLPCFAECLELRDNKKFGRHIVTNRNLKTGDVIAVTEPSFVIFEKRAQLHHCSHCTKSSMKLNLIPCMGCTGGE